MSNPTEFKKGFDRTLGGCSALLYVMALVLGIGFIICAGCMWRVSSTSPLPPVPMKGSFR